MPVPIAWGKSGSQQAGKKQAARIAIDRTEVTQAAYDGCVRAGVCRARRQYDGAEQPKYPAVGVSWRDAHTYCAFVGKRLPTEREWERAAQGEAKRKFPWGDKLDCKRANYGNFGGAGPCSGRNPGRVTTVGQYEAGRTPQGAVDMAGNAWEWVAEKVLKGGGCCSFFTKPTTSVRLKLSPHYVDNDIGFRCVGTGIKKINVGTGIN